MSTELVSDSGQSTNGASVASGEAAQAFDELRLEVLKTQQAMEEIRAAITGLATPDYTPSLAAIVQAITKVKAELQRLQSQPADYQHALMQTSQTAMREAIAQLTETRLASQRTHQDLINTLGTARSRQQQAWWLAIVAGVGLVVGMLLAPFFSRLLPFGLDTRIAALVMASDRWKGGARLMRAGNPEGWEEIENA